ncbi:MAG TPA: efflux RND transporter periplasmic adaptor subunit [Steroidobacteraceae bacterium]|nr:efflux RND transporter periplasmic adaptor subunit [Steroidobacteraceae bacterium]
MLDNQAPSVGGGLLQRRNRILWAASAAVIVIGSLATYGWLHRAPALRYVTAKVTRGDIQRTVTMTGTLNPIVTAQVESYVSGNIKTWTCDYNTIVKVGQICATLDPLPFQVVVDQDTASLHSAEAALAKDRVAVANQAKIYAYDQKLIGEGIVSQEQINTDKATLDQDRAQVNLDIANVAQQTALLHGAKVNLAYTKIPSPVNGMVITRYIDVGQTVVSSLSASPLFLIGKDMHVMEVDTNVSEADVGGVKHGERSFFTVQAYPTRTFWGSVRQVREGPITVQNVVTYDVVVDVKNDDLALFPGMTADCHIITAERRDVLRVPLPAIRFNPEGLAGERSGRGSRGSGEGARSGGNASSGEGGSESDGAQAPGEGGDRVFEHAVGDGAGGGAGRFAGRRGRGGAARARIWVMRDGKLVPVRVRTGLDDGTLIEVSGDDLHEGDVVVVNAVRPNQPRTEVRAGQNNNGPGGNGLRGGGFRF